MKIIMGSVVRGYALKMAIKTNLEKQGHEVIDVGCFQTDKFVKFPSIAQRIANALQEGAAPLAISCCGSGTGACICANKFKNISAVSCESELTARFARLVNDCNCLCLGESVVTPEMACRIADVFISTDFQDAKGTAQNILDFWKEARDEAMGKGIIAESREIEII
jgi:ribose 5-phosphate isomerase B